MSGMWTTCSNCGRECYSKESPALCPVCQTAEERKRKIADLKAENARLSKRVGELEAEKRILKDEMEAVDQMLAARNERIESLEAQLDKLHGHKFSERDFTAIASRAETAEARLAQAERLLRSKADRLHIPCGNHWLPDPDVAAFFHPEKEKPCKS